MKKLISLLSVSFLLVTNLYALETDQYLMWNHSIKDSTVGINNYFNRIVKNGLIKLNEKKDAAELSCKKASEFIVQQFLKNNTLTEDQIEIELKDYKEVELYPDPHNRKEMLNATIYREFTSLFAKDGIFPVAPNIKVNGIYIGTDKLGHFISLGLRYFTVYNYSFKNNHDVVKAYQDAIDLGIGTENTYYGKLTSGVFSHADLEANFQGLLFILKMCDETNPYLKLNEVNGVWFQNAQIDLRNYVNPNWNETYNPSHYQKSEWKKVTDAFRTDNYCQKLQTSPVQSLLASYKKRDILSYSKYYIDTKIKLGEIENNWEHSLKAFCEQEFFY